MTEIKLFWKTIAPMSSLQVCRRGRRRCSCCLRPGPRCMPSSGPILRPRRRFAARPSPSDTLLNIPPPSQFLLRYIQCMQALFYLTIAELPLALTPGHLERAQSVFVQVHCSVSSAGPKLHSLPIWQHGLKLASIYTLSTLLNTPEECNTWFIHLRLIVTLQSLCQVPSKFVI